MDLKKKTAITGDIAIICNITAFILTMLSFNFICVLVFIIMIIWSNAKIEYLELRKQEIDEQLLNEMEDK
jgi:hypothetical protein